MGIISKFDELAMSGIYSGNTMLILSYILYKKHNTNNSIDNIPEKIDYVTALMTGNNRKE